MTLTAERVQTVAAPTPKRRRGRSAGRPRALWWATPAGSIALVVPLSLLVSVTISDRDYRLFYKTPKAITASDALLYLLAGAILVLGAAIPLVSGRKPLARNWPTLDIRQLRVLDRGAAVSFWLTITGYVLLLGAGFARGARLSTFVHAFTSQNNESGTLKDTFAPIAGITSLTQVGVAYVVMAAVLRCHGAGRHTGRRLTIVLLLGLLRSFFLSERLAILELVVPLVLITAVRARQRSRRASVIPALPVFALPILAVVFGAFEYSRSWQFYKSRTTLSLPEFLVNRLAGYYATAYNNGSLQLRFGDRAGWLPYNSFQGLWTSPGLAQLHLYKHLTGSNGPDALNTVIAQHGNPEFNNPGGLAVPLFDFGIPGGLLYFLIAGIIVGFAYRSFRSGDPLGLLIYPMIFTGLLELPRYIYWTEGRAVPAYIVLGIAAYRMRRRPAVPKTHESVRT